MGPLALSGTGLSPAGPSGRGQGTTSLRSEQGTDPKAQSPECYSKTRCAAGQVTWQARECDRQEGGAPTSAGPRACASAPSPRGLALSLLGDLGGPFLVLAGGRDQSPRECTAGRPGVQDRGSQPAGVQESPCALSTPGYNRANPGSPSPGRKSSASALPLAAPVRTLPVFSDPCGPGALPAGRLPAVFATLPMGPPSSGLLQGQSLVISGPTKTTASQDSPLSHICEDPISTRTGMRTGTCLLRATIRPAMGVLLSCSVCRVGGSSGVSSVGCGWPFLPHSTGLEPGEYGLSSGSPCGLPDPLPHLP